MCQLWGNAWKSPPDMEAGRCTARWERVPVRVGVPEWLTAPKRKGLNHRDTETHGGAQSHRIVASTKARRREGFTKPSHGMSWRCRLGGDRAPSTRYGPERPCRAGWKRPLQRAFEAAGIPACRFKPIQMRSRFGASSKQHAVRACGDGAIHRRGSLGNLILWRAHGTGYGVTRLGSEVDDRTRIVAKTYAAPESLPRTS